MSKLLIRFTELYMIFWIILFFIDRMLKTIGFGISFKQVLVPLCVAVILGLFYYFKNKETPSWSLSRQFGLRSALIIFLIYISFFGLFFTLLLDRIEARLGPYEEWMTVAAFLGYVLINSFLYLCIIISLILGFKGGGHLGQFMADRKTDTPSSSKT